MVTITQTVEETLMFTAKPPRRFQKEVLKSNEDLSEVSLSECQTSVKPSKACPRDCQACIKPIEACPPDCQECKIKYPCPPNCKLCQPQKKTLPLVFNIIGIIVALIATYMIVATDSKLYLVFWVCYSVLRRLMTKSNKLREKTD